MDRRPGRLMDGRSSSIRSVTASHGSTAWMSMARHLSRSPQRVRRALSPAFTHDGRLAFTARRNDRWTIVTTLLDGSDLRLDGDTVRDYWAPAYDLTSGRLLAHGPGPIDVTSRFESDAPGPFLIHPPRLVHLPDRALSLMGIRGYLPTLNPNTGEVATSEAFCSPRGVQAGRHGEARGLRPSGDGPIPRQRFRMGALLVQGRSVGWRLVSGVRSALPLRMSTFGRVALMAAGL